MLFKYKKSLSKKGRSKGSDEIIIDAASYTSIHKPPAKKRKSLDVLSKKQLRRRLEDVINTLQRFSEEEQVEVDSLLGLLLTFSKTKQLVTFGEKVWSNTCESNLQVPLSTTLAVYNDCKLGRGTFGHLRKILKGNQYFRNIKTTI